MGALEYILSIISVFVAEKISPIEKDKFDFVFVWCILMMIVALISFVLTEYGSTAAIIVIIFIIALIICILAIPIFLIVLIVRLIVKNIKKHKNDTNKL